ncbi:MAG: hypothetical protein IT483_15750 [Gammaproteobacteria bacterium]|nr:hypothetical protein [Gammaproteobacteria bacterium]
MTAAAWSSVQAAALVIERGHPGLAGQRGRHHLIDAALDAVERFDFAVGVLVVPPREAPTFLSARERAHTGAVVEAACGHFDGAKVAWVFLAGPEVAELARAAILADLAPEGWA